MSEGPLAGRLALVTGGSKGIGAAIAEALRVDGASVIRAARTIAPDAPPGERHVICDLASDAGVAALAAEVARQGVPDLVVSSAGGFALGRLEDVPVETLDQLYRVNLRAPYELARRFLPLMRARGHGRHILIGSIADHLAIPGNGAYTATKFGARGLHEVLREELRGSGVLATLVSPGPVDTPLWDPIDPDHRPDLPSRAAMLRPDDVAAAVRWIASRPRHVDVPWLQLGPA